MKLYHLQTMVTKKQKPLFLVKDNQDKLVKVYTNVCEALDQIKILNREKSLSVNEILSNTHYNILKSLN